MYFKYFLVRKFFHQLQLEYHHGLKDSLHLDGPKIAKLLGFCFSACAFSLPERFTVRSWQWLLLMAWAKCCAPLSVILLALKSYMCSWQLLSLMASAKCYAPLSLMLLFERSNVCSWLILLMNLAKCCAPLSVVLLSLGSNMGSWQLLLLMA